VQQVLALIRHMFDLGQILSPAAVKFVVV